MSFCMDDEKLLEPIWIKIEDLSNIELDALPVHDNRYIKTKIRTYGDNIYTNFCCLNLPEDDTECEFFYSYFYWFLTFIQREILSANVFRQ